MAVLHKKRTKTWIGAVIWLMTTSSRVKREQAPL